MELIGIALIMMGAACIGFVAGVVVERIAWNKVLNSEQGQPPKPL